MRYRMMLLPGVVMSCFVMHACADSVDDVLSYDWNNQNQSGQTQYLPGGTDSGQDSGGQRDTGNQQGQQESNNQQGNNSQQNQQGSGSQQGTSTPKSSWKAEDWARARISKSVSTDEAFDNIAQSGGFPVVTDDNTLIFMHWYEGGNWALAGDLNNWVPQSMARDGDVVYVEVPVPTTDKLSYKFVNTDTNEYMADPWAHLYYYDSNGELSYIYKPNSQYMMRWMRFKSPQGLKDRNLRVWVPAGEGPFNVLYAHDGAAIFPDGGQGGWWLRSTLENIKADFIVVGIDNTEDRMMEYAHVDDNLGQCTPEWGNATYVAKGDTYGALIDDTIRPMIERNLNTTGIAGLMGSSLGGLISLYIAHLYPGRYQMAIALSPTTAWGDFGLRNKTIKDIYIADGLRQNLVLYVDSGGGEGSGCKFNSQDACEDEKDRDNYCYTRDFANQMSNIGYTYDVNLFHQYIPGALHTNEAWADRVYKPLEIFRDKF